MAMPWLPIPCAVMRLDNEEQAVALWLYREAWSCSFLPIRCSLRQVAKRYGFCRLKLTSALKQLQSIDCISFTTQRSGTTIIVSNPLEIASKPQTDQNATTFSNHQINHQNEPQASQNAATKSEVDTEETEEVNPQSDQDATTFSNQESCHLSKPQSDHSATNTVYKENIHTTRADERDAHTREGSAPVQSEAVSREDFNEVAVVYTGILATLTNTLTQKPKYDDQRKSSAAVGLKKLIRQHEAAEVILTLRWMEHHGGELRDEVAAGRRVWLPRRWRKIRRGYQASKHTPPPRRPKAAPTPARGLDLGQHKALAGKLLTAAMRAQQAGIWSRRAAGYKSVLLTDDEVLALGGEPVRFRHALESVGGLRGFDRDLQQLSTDFGWAYAKHGGAQ